jgi:exopolysaccharide biosynthesis polyprenyl glycosylphosphotransferase
MLDLKSPELRRVTLLLDAGATVLAFLAAYQLRAWAMGGAAELVPHLGLVPLIVPLWVFLLTFFHAYRSPLSTAMLDLAWAVARSVITGLVLLQTALFLAQAQSVSRLVLFAFAVLDVLALIAIRLGVRGYLRRALRRGENLRRVLVIGTGSRATRLVRALTQQPSSGIQVVGHLDPDGRRVGTRVLDRPVLGTTDEITSVLKDHVIDDVILSIPRTLIPDVEKVARACEEEGVRMRVMADLFDVKVARMTLDQLGDIPLMTLEPVAHEEWELLVKRLMDLAVAVLLLPILLPLMAVIAVAIKLDSAGPVLFSQPRVGLNKRRFRIYKFRTMVQGAERLQEKLEHLNEARGPVFKIRNDPRITRVGRLLRKTSLDELPQLLNVLRGEMSLVGPRPLPLRDVSLFDQGIQRKRFSVKPGITGLWQISGRSNVGFATWVELDLRYIEHWSLGLDLKILARTIPVVLRGVGAV